MIDQYDVLMLVAEKDIQRANLCLESLKFLVPAPHGVYVITPSGKLPGMKDQIAGLNVFYLKDDDVLKVPRDKGFYPNWTYQQCVKLMQDVTPCRWYMSIDSDVIFLKRFPVMTKDRRPIFWNFSFAKFTTYDIMLRKAWGVSKIIDHSMICHIMMFNKDLCEDLLGLFLLRHPNESGVTDQEHFFRWMIENQTEDIQMAEPEIYANFVVGSCPNMYDTKELIGADTCLYEMISENDVKDVVARMCDEYPNIEIAAVHSRLISS